MSVFLDLADKIAELLNHEGTGLVGIEALVIRQKNLDDRVKEATQKKGKFGTIGIRWVGFANADPDAVPARLKSEYLVAVACKPTLRKGQPPMDDVLEVVLRTLHGHTFEAKHCYYELEVGNGSLVGENDSFLIYQFSVKAITQL